MPDQTMKPCREAYVVWNNSPNRPPLDDPNGGDAPTGFEAGWQAAKADQAETIRELTDACQSYTQTMLEQQSQLEARDRRIAELLEASDEFRDSVLNQRGPLEEPCLDNDQTNALLSLYDDTIGQALAKHTGNAVEGDASVVDDDLLIGMLKAARPDVSQQVVADFVKGKSKNLDYLTCDLAEFRRIAAYLRSPVPVMVSLETILRGMNETWDGSHPAWKEVERNRLKSVLDAAGVKYGN